MVEEDLSGNADVPTSEQEVDFVIDLLRNNRYLPRVREKDFVDVKFCCDDGIFEFHRYLADLKGEDQFRSDFLIPKAKAFSVQRLSPTLAFLAFRLFNARKVSSEDTLEWKESFKPELSFKERANIGLRWRVCEKHQVKRST